MPWHLSKSNPCKVYDERHEVVCVCSTAEQAARIVANATGQPVQSVKLREPAETSAPTDIFVHDECCNAPLSKAIRSGRLARETLWSCPRCGCDWTVCDGGAVRKWEPVSMLAVWGGKR